MNRMIVTVAVMAGVFCSSLSAMQVIAAGGQVSVGSPKDRMVSINVHNAPLLEVINDIASQARLQLSYFPATIPANKRVTLKLQNISVQDALATVLRGTGVEIKTLLDGQIALARKEVAKDGVAQGVIAGKVTDAKTGRGIAGANVAVDNNGRGVITGDDGSFRLVGIVTGAHTVAVRLVGYAKQTRSVMVGEGATVAVDFKLDPSANVLDQVVVTGTVVASELRSVPNAITVITAKQIEERGITRIDQLFRGEIPGLFSLERGTNALLDQVIMFSRGAARISNQVPVTAANYTSPIKTYVDGVELVDAQYLSQIDPRSIERIEILTGPQASTIYGANAINGVMQIFTKRGSVVRPQFTFSIFSGVAQNNFSSALASSHSSDASVSSIEGRFSYNVGSSWNYTGAWSPGKQMQRTSVYGGSRYQSGPIALDLSARQGWTTNRQRGGASQVQTGLSEDGRFVRFSGLVAPVNRSLYGRTLGLTMSYSPLAWWSHQATVGSDASDIEQLGLSAGFTSQGDTIIGGNSQSNNIKVSQSYSSTLRIPVSLFAQATLTYGADHWRNRSSTVEWDVNPSGTIASPFVQRDKPGKNSGAYVQGQLGLWDALFFTYGVRADWNPNYGEKAKVRPGRYGISYSREFGMVSAKLRGSYGRSIRPPTNGQMRGVAVTSAAQINVFGSPLYSTLPSSELGPEFQQGGEGGIELYLGNRGSLVMTRYNQTVDGLIYAPTVDSIRALQPGVIGASGSLCTTAGEVRSDGYCYRLQSLNLNVGSIRNQGWEMQGNINTGPLTTSGTYSWTKSRVVGITPKYRALLTDQAFTPGIPFNFLPEHTWAMNMSYARQGTSVSINVNGIGTTLRNGNSELDLVVSSALRLRTEEAQRMDLPGTYRRAVADYIMANLNATRYLSQKIEGALQVTNLTNFYQNDVNVLNPVLGRQFRLGMRLRIQ